MAVALIHQKLSSVPIPGFYPAKRDANLDLWGLDFKEPAMLEQSITCRARQLAERSVSTGRPVLHAEVRALAFLAGGSRSAIDDAMLGVFAEAEAERRRADPAAPEA